MPRSSAPCLFRTWAPLPWPFRRRIAWARRGDDGRWRILGDPAHKIVNASLFRVDEVLELVGLGGSVGVSGQGCVCHTRALVHRDVYEQFLAVCEGMVAFTVYGDPFDAGTAPALALRSSAAQKSRQLPNRSAGSAAAWSSTPIRHLTVTGMLTASRMAIMHSATISGSAIRHAPNRPLCRLACGRRSARRRAWSTPSRTPSSSRSSTARADASAWG